MAKHVSARLLRPSQIIAVQKPAAASQNLRPIRHDPGSLPPTTVLYRKPIHPGPPLPASSHANDLPTIKHGQHIYLYTNIFTNQVVYSLTRHLNNAAALSQLPFLGKKTQPSHLRKDLWTPFALAVFPSPHAGINAFRKLREFRRLHETSWPLDTMRDPEQPRNLLPKKKRGKVLMNQRANSIADLAAVLLQQEAGVSEKRKERWERVSRRVRRLVKQKRLEGEDMVGERRRQRLEKVDVVQELQGVEGVKVHWVDIRDAEFAERWPKDVVHEVLGKSRYTAAWPARDVLKEREEKAREVGAEALKAEQINESPSEEAVKEGLAPPPKRTWRERLFGPKSAATVTAA